MTDHHLTIDQAQLRLRAMGNLIRSRGYGHAHAFLYVAGDYVKIGVRFGVDPYGMGSREAWFDDIDKVEEFVTTQIPTPAEYLRAEAIKTLEEAQKKVEDLNANH